MQVVLLVHVSQALQGLKHYVAYQLLREKLTPFSHQLIHVQVQVLKYELQSVLLEADFIEAHNIRVGKL